MIKLSAACAIIRPLLASADRAQIATETAGCADFKPLKLVHVPLLADPLRGSSQLGGVRPLTELAFPDPASSPVTSHDADGTANCQIWSHDPSAMPLTCSWKVFLLQP